MSKKYEFVEGDEIDDGGSILTRIRALESIPVFSVNAGDLGGYIETEGNLPHDDSSWVFPSARVIGKHSRVVDSGGVEHSTVRRSRIVNSRVEASTVRDSVVLDSEVKDSTVDHSRVAASVIKHSRVEDRKVEYSWVRDGVIINGETIEFIKSAPPPGMRRACDEK